MAKRFHALEQVKDWLRANFREEVGGYVAKREVFEAYQAFCCNSGFPPTNDATFGKIFKSVFPRVQVRRLVRRVKAKRWHYCQVSPTILAKTRGDWDDKHDGVAEKTNLQKTISKQQQAGGPTQAHHPNGKRNLVPAHFSPGKTKRKRSDDDNKLNDNSQKSGPRAKIDTPSDQDRDPVGKDDDEEWEEQEEGVDGEDQENEDRHDDDEEDEEDEEEAISPPQPARALDFLNEVPSLPEEPSTSSPSADEPPSALVGWPTQITVNLAEMVFSSMALHSSLQGSDGMELHSTSTLGLLPFIPSSEEFLSSVPTLTTTMTTTNCGNPFTTAAHHHHPHHHHSFTAADRSEPQPSATICGSANQHSACHPQPFFPMPAPYMHQDHLYMGTESEEVFLSRLLVDHSCEVMTVGNKMCTWEEES